VGAAAGTLDRGAIGGRAGRPLTELGAEQHRPAAPAGCDHEQVSRPAVTDENAVLRQLLDLALAVAAEPRAERVLRRVLEVAREITHARYAAVGVPDGAGGFALFLTSGVDAATWAAIGELPRQHGLLATLLADPTSVRLQDIRQDPRFAGWPPGHPDMSAFLGVPVVAGGEILAELYLTDKIDDDGGAMSFTATDQALVETTAAHAALAIANADRAERIRDLSAAQERARLARDLHDSVTQTLFSLTLAVASAAALAGAADRALVEQIGRVRGLGAAALDEMRELVETLRPADPEHDDLATMLRKRAALTARLHKLPVEVAIDENGPPVGSPLRHELAYIAAEALANAVQHAAASRIRMAFSSTPAAARLQISDDGAGFDVVATRRATRRLGLRSMSERAAAVGGVLRVESGPGAGTTITVEVARD